MSSKYGTGTIEFRAANTLNPYMLRKTITRDGVVQKVTVGSYPTREMAELAREMMADYTADDIARSRMTFDELFIHMVTTECAGMEQEPPFVKKLRTSYRKCGEMHHRVYQEISYYDMQGKIDSLGHSVSQKRELKSLFIKMDREAERLGIMGKRYACLLLPIREDPLQERRRRFPLTDREVEAILAHGDDRDMFLAWLLLYTGYRAGELTSRKKTDVDLREYIIYGGLKTYAGMERKIPIVRKIRPIVEKLMSYPGEYLLCNPDGSRITEEALLARVRMAIMPYAERPHDDHEFRHTFYTRYREQITGDKDLDIVNFMMGHELSTEGARFYLGCSAKFLNDFAEKYLWK